MEIKILKNTARCQRSDFSEQLDITRMPEVYFGSYFCIIIFLCCPLYYSSMKKSYYPSKAENFSFPVGCLIARSMLALTVAAGRRCVSLILAKWRFLKQHELAQLHCSQWEYTGSHQKGLWLSWLTDWITFTNNFPFRD